MFRNMKIVTKVKIVALIGVLGLMIVAANIIPGLNSIGGEIEEIAEYQIPLSATVAELEKDLLEEEILTYKIVIASKESHSEKLQEIEHHIAKMEQETDESIKKAEELAKGAIEHNHDDEKTKAEYEKFLGELQLLEHLQSKFEHSLKSFEKDIQSEGSHHYETDLKELHHELQSMDGNITHLEHQMEILLGHSTHKAEKDEHSLLISILIVGAVVFILAVIIPYIVTKQIENSIGSFEEGLLGFFRYLNREADDTQYLDDSTNDEIGNMAKVINQNISITKEGIENDRKVIDDTISVLSEFEQGDLCQRVHVTTNNPALQELTRLLNKMGGNIEMNIDNVLDILEQYAHSNYLNKVDTKGLKEHLLKLANGVNVLGDSITDMLIKNKENGMILDQSSDMLLQNVDVLNRNSNEAASALEETAAALEEITSNISNNTHNIVKMSSYASELTKSAKDGESLARETTNAMDDINERVLSINEAISVIDQIAFQTNILSLNAAVEAATAGEAGKGFAVVAGEVRNLASRSSDAANEIKNIVEDATNKADVGKKISNTMISGYNGLNENITQTIDLISGIEIASKEQQGGIV